MNPYRTNAKIVGTLFITAIVAGVLSVAVLNPILQNPDFLINVGVQENRITLGALSVVIMAFACAGIAIWLYPVLRIYNEALALGSVAFRLIETALFMVATIGLLSLVPLSQAYTNAAPIDAPRLLALGLLIQAARDWTSQVLGVIAFSLGALMYYYVFYRSRLIPRWLSGWGLIAISLHLATGFLLMFALVKPFSMVQVVMNLPIFFQETVLALWLIAKGFNPNAIETGLEGRVSTALRGKTRHIGQSTAKRQ